MKYRCVHEITLFGDPHHGWRLFSFSLGDNEAGKFTSYMEQWVKANLMGEYQLGVWSLVCQSDEDAMLVRLAFT